MTSSLARARFLLLGMGFGWMLLWSLLGALQAFDIHEAATSVDPEWLQGWERELLRSAHAHMNSMAMWLVLQGLSLPLLARQLPPAWIGPCCAISVLSLPLFGAGLVLQSRQVPRVGEFYWQALVSGAGAFLFYAVLLVWSAASLLAAARRERA